MAMQVQIPRLVYEKIMHWVSKTDIEVSGFGRCTYYPETEVLWVHDAFLAKQQGGSAHTDIDAESHGKMLFDARGKEGTLRWWWHSHVNMPVFWSGQDTATIKQLSMPGWHAATVFNKKYQTRSAIGVRVESKSMLTGKDEIMVHIYDELPTFIMTEGKTTELEKEWDEQFKENVLEKKYVPPYQNYQSYDDYRRDGGSSYVQKEQERAAETDEKKRQETERPSLFSVASDAHMSEDMEVDPQSLAQLPIAEDEGFYGYGLIREAQVLGMSPFRYRAILDSVEPDMRRLKDDIEKQLAQAEKEGKLCLVTDLRSQVTPTSPAN